MASTMFKVIMCSLTLGGDAVSKHKAALEMGSTADVSMADIGKHANHDAADAHTRARAGAPVSVTDNDKHGNRDAVRVNVIHADENVRMASHRHPTKLLMRRKNTDRQGEVRSDIGQDNENVFSFYGYASRFKSVEMPQPTLQQPSKEPYGKEYSATNESYSQHEQDLILLPILKQMSPGFFVESGARNGYSDSNSLLYERKYGWKGLLVEPDPEMFSAIHSKVHRHAYAFQGALSPTGHAATLEFVANEGGRSHLSGYGAGPLDQVHVNVQNGQTLSVQCQPLHKLLEPIGQDAVDFWSLDIEGSEGTVLKSTDFGKVEVGVMLIEMNKEDKNNREIREVMTKEGFVNIGHTGSPPPHSLDQIFVNPKYFQKRGLPVPTSEVIEPRYRN